MPSGDVVLVHVSWFSRESQLRCLKVVRCHIEVPLVAWARMIPCWSSLMDNERKQTKLILDIQESVPDSPEKGIQPYIVLAGKAGLRPGEKPVTEPKSLPQRTRQVFASPGRKAHLHEGRCCRRGTACGRMYEHFWWTTCERLLLKLITILIAL